MRDLSCGVPGNRRWPMFSTWPRWHASTKPLGGFRFGVLWTNSRRKLGRAARLKQRIGIPPGLAAAGVKREHLPRLVEIATRDICHQTNPRPCEAADFERFFTEAF